MRLPAVRPGEFLERNPHRFNDPPQIDPFSFDESAEGYMPFNEQFAFDPAAEGYQPFNEQFSFDIPGTQPTDPRGQVGEGETAQGRMAEWGWEDQGDGNWLHPESGARGHFRGDGTFLNETAGKVWSPTSGNISDLSAQGYQPLNEQFAFDDAGYQPFGTEFEFDDAGYQPFGTEFEFDTEDLYNDPGYQWRRDQGNKAVERSAAAGGMLQSGKTLKSLQRWSQGLAAQEYRDAYGRSRSEFDQRRDQTRWCLRTGVGRVRSTPRSDQGRLWAVP